MSFRLIATFCLLVAPQAYLLAQPSGPAAPGSLRSEVRLHVLHFDNFLHVADSSMAIDVNAVAGEYRIAQRLQEQPVDLYAHLNLIHYDQSGIDASYGGRVGGVLNGQRHYLNAWLDHQENRPSFEVGNVFGRADTTTFVTDYSIRVVPDWQIGADGMLQRQSFPTPGRDNDYNRLGASLRYRGFGRYFSPEVGFNSGRRDVTDRQESYDEDDLYFQVYSLPRDTIYLSLRFAQRDRSYITTDPTSRNFGRSEERGVWTFVLDWRTSQRLSWLLYASSEDVDTAMTSGDFRTGVILFGPKIRL